MRPITERLSPVIKYLVIANALVYAFYLFVGDWRPLIQAHLAVSPLILRGEIWQPVTALFVHVHVINFLFNMLGLWFVGATIERQLGTTRFLTMFFAIGVVSNLVLAGWMLLFGTELVGAGCGASVIALFIAYGTIYDRTQTRILGGLVLEARTFAALLMGFVILQNLANRAWPFLFADLVAMLMGYLMAGGRGEGIKRLWSSAHARRVRRKYQVLEGGRRGTRPEDLN